ncbi:MAG: NFACT family protein [Bacilli bacterium]|nr:NFACT family protein [Bacilli bacterium]
MALTYAQLSKVQEALKKRLLGMRLAHLGQYAPAVFSYRLNAKEKLVIDINGANPAIYISSTWEERESLSTNFYLYLRKETAGAIVNSIELWGEDRILSFTLEAMSPTFKPITLYLVAELIPGKSNLLLLDEEKKILIAYRTGSFHEDRFLARGAQYLVPEKPEYGKNQSMPPFDFAEYCQNQRGREEKLLALRKKEKYKPLFDLLKRKIKSGEKKIARLQDDQEEAKKHLHDGDYGNFIFMNMETLDPTTGWMDYYGEKVELDPAKSLSDNAQRFFKRAKKAKTALNLQEINQKRVRKELSLYQDAQTLASYADEETLDALMERFDLSKEKKKKNGKKHGIASSDLPYLVQKDGVTYLYGKNARQNDFLSFHLDTAKSHTWIHVLGDHGAHLIIRKENPSKEEISLACQLALLLSDKEDGDVMVALKKDVRKGNVPGQAIVEHYESFHFSKIEEEAKALLKEEKRISL